MAIEWISKKMIIDKGDESKKADFKFPNGTIGTYLVGIQAFLSKYKGDTHHKVGELGIELSSSKKENTITVTLTPHLKDKSKNSLDTSESWVQVVVIAQVNMAESKVLFDDTDMSGDPYKTYDHELQENLICAAVCLRSFKSAFGTSTKVDHDINLIGASCSAEPQNKSALLNANFLIKKDEKTVSTKEILDLNIIGITTGLNAGLAMRTVHFTSGKAGQTPNTSTKEVEFDFDVESAIALITGFEMKYEGTVNHNVGTIMVGASKWGFDGVGMNYLPGSDAINGANPAIEIKFDPKTKVSKVTITSNASMFEMSNSKIKNESDSNKVTYLILAIPK